MILEICLNGGVRVGKEAWVLQPKGWLQGRAAKLLLVRRKSRCSVHLG